MEIDINDLDRRLAEERAEAAEAGITEQDIIDAIKYVRQNRQTKINDNDKFKTV